MAQDQSLHNIYALFVGIDAYVSPVSPLQGCVNDIRAIQSYLSDRINPDRYQLHLKSLLNQAATRQAVIEGFQQHLSQAGEHDIVLFYYSGHGSQEAAPPEFWPIEPDRMCETLVCWDSRTAGGKDLADKELAYLIYQLSQTNPQIIMILDCCHSGSGTREIVPTGFRHSPADERPRTLEDFIFAGDQEYLSNLLQRDRNVSPTIVEDRQSGWQIPVGRHILLAGCHDSELASEYSNEGELRGAFSYFLVDTLRNSQGSLSYRDLFKRASSLVRGRIKDQSPQLEAVHSEDLNLPFLGFKDEDAIAPRPPYYTLSRNDKQEWVIDGGAVHGFPHASAEPIKLALYPQETAATDMRQLSQAVGEVQTIQVFPSYSTVQFVREPIGITSEQVFNAVVTHLPITPLGVYFDGNDEAIAMLREAIAPSGQPSLYIKEVDESHLAKLRVQVQGTQWQITQPMDDRLLVEPIQGFSASNAFMVIQRLEHIARWTTLLELSSPPSGSLPSDAVDVLFSSQGQEMTDPVMRLTYDAAGNPSTFELQLTNRTARRLYCALLDLTEEYSVSAPFFATGGTWIEPGQTLPVTASIRGNLVTQIPTTIPKRLWQAGVTEYQDVLKLIVSTDEFDAQLLTQEKLDKPAPPTTRSLTTTSRSSLNQLMQQVTTRGIADEDELEILDEWMTHQITIVTCRDQNGTPISQQPQRLVNGMQLGGHPALKGTARLTSVSQSTRSAIQAPLPAFLQEHTEPLQFTSSRGVDGGLSVLELTEVERWEAVTEDQPLTLEIPVSLAEDEHVIPVAYDGEFYLPLGRSKHRAGQTEIELQRLPQPMVNRRSVAGAIQIYFQKVIYKKLGQTLSDRLGITFNYPILADTEVSEGKVTQVPTVDLVKQRVSQAQRIVLFIHGIFGDTASMVPCVEMAEVKLAEQTQRMEEIYDLVLSYDYESINTSIKTHAENLKQRLKEVGIEAGHGKTVHIVAHSMGGLVSRYFIENLGGNEIVQHLIMLGTPNAGSPWPEVQRGVTEAVAYVINGLSLAAVPVRLLGGVLDQIEKIDITLDEMEPGSEFLGGLLSNNDPQIPYSVVVGNTSLILQDETATLRERLRRKLSRQVELPFKGQPNDIAVTVASIKGVPVQRSPQPVFEEVACNHLVYFNDPAGLNGLGNAIARAFDIQNSNDSLLGLTNEKGIVAEEPEPSAEEQRLNTGAGTENFADRAEPESDETIKPKTAYAKSTGLNNGWLKGTIAVAALAVLLLGFAILKKTPKQQKPQPKSALIRSFHVHECCEIDESS